MKAVRTLFFVLLSVGVAAPVAASPTVPATAWPGVSDVLLTVAAPAPVAAWPGVLAAWPGLRHSHFVGMGTPSKAGAWPCDNFTLARLVAEFRNFANDEDFTDQPPPGISVYNKILDVPDGCDTLYVTISAVGDGHLGNATWLTCKVDFVFCNPGAGAATGTPGWIAVQRHGVLDDFHDNSVYYTWCTAITPGTHAVEIRMASSHDDPADGVFLETEHFYVDASNTGGGCVQAGPTDDPTPLLPHLQLPRLP